MIGLDFLQDLRDRAPQCFAAFAQQSVETQEKIVELIARKANLVSREDFERQKQICVRLQERISALEAQLAALHGSQI